MICCALRSFCVECCVVVFVLCELVSWCDVMLCVCSGMLGLCVWVALVLFVVCIVLFVVLSLLLFCGGSCDCGALRSV